MIDAFKEMLDLVKHAPEYTMWVLLGILFYKVFIAGTWVMVARLLIVKLHDFVIRPPHEKTVKCKIIDMTLGITEERLAETLRMVIPKHHQYFHENHLRWLEDAIKEKKEREAKAKNV